MWPFCLFLLWAAGSAAVITFIPLVADTCKANVRLRRRKFQWRNALCGRASGPFPRALFSYLLVRGLEVNTAVESQSPLKATDVAAALAWRDETASNTAAEGTPAPCMLKLRGIRFGEPAGPMPLLGAAPVNVVVRPRIHDHESSAA